MVEDDGLRALRAPVLVEDGRPVRRRHLATPCPPGCKATSLVVIRGENSWDGSRRSKNIDDRRGCAPFLGGCSLAAAGYRLSRRCCWRPGSSWCRSSRVPPHARRATPPPLYRTATPSS